MRFQKSEEQRFTENHAFAKDRETSFKNTLFYKSKIVYPIFYYQKIYLETKHISFSDIKLAALKQF